MQGWDNQGQNQNYNQYGSYNNNNYGFVNNNANTNKNVNPNNKQRPPIPFTIGNINETIANSQKYVSSTKKIFEKLKQ